MKASTTALLVVLTLSTSASYAATNPEVNATLRKGRGFTQAGEPLKALPVFEMALKLATAKSPGSVDEAEALSELGECYREAGQSAKALPLLEKAIDIAEKKGDREISIAALANLALLLSDAGKYKDSLACYMRCLSEIGKMPHPDTSTQAKLENNMGLLLEKSELHEQAIRMYQRSLDHAADDESLNGLRVSCLGNMAMSYRAAKNLPKAEECASQAVNQAKESLGEDNLDTGFVLAQQGMILVESKKFKEAKPVLSQAIAILQKSLGAEHPQVADVKASYAECLAGLK